MSARTEAECRRRLRDRQREIAKNGMPSEEISVRTTVKSWADTWFDMIVRNARPNYFSTTRSLIQHWVIPEIGHRPLSDLTPRDVRAVTAAVMRAGRSSTTAGHAQAALLRMLKAAILEGHTIQQRVLLSPMPKKGISDREALPLDQAIAALAVAARRPDGSRWAAAFLQGLRQGEALGLAWARVDMEKGYQIIDWQLQPLPYADREAKTFRIPDGYKAQHLVDSYHLVAIKSKAGERAQPIVPWMTNALTAWREISPMSPYDLVWPHASGRPRRANSDTAEWRDIQREAGIAHPSGRPWKVHEIRHTTATLLMELGVDEKVITAIMGHTSAVTTAKYQHVRDAQIEAALAKMANVLELRAAPE